MQLQIRSGKEIKELQIKKNKNTTVSSKRIKQKVTNQLLPGESSVARRSFETSNEDRTQQEEKKWVFFVK